MNWGITMTERKDHDMSVSAPDDAELDLFFRAARAHPPEMPDDLAARILSDAEAETRRRAGHKGLHAPWRQLQLPARQHDPSPLHAGRGHAGTRHRPVPVRKRIHRRLL